MTQPGLIPRVGHLPDRPRLRTAIGVFSVVFFVVALGVLYLELRTYSYGMIVRAVGNYSVGTLMFAAGSAALSYIVMTSYDVLAFRYLGTVRSYRETILPAFTAFAVGNTVGYALLVGGSIRYRLYSVLGVSTKEIVYVAVFASSCRWIGYSALAGVAFVASPASFATAAGFSPLPLRGFGVVLVALPVAYLAVAARRRSLELRGREVSIPSLPIATAQLGLSALDWTAAAAVLYLLLPAGSELSFLTFLTIYLLSMLVGLLSRVPGGLGVFEAAILSLVPGSLSIPGVVGALVVYRALYYLFPLSIAGVALGAESVSAHRSSAATVSRTVGAWAPRVVADVAAVLVVVAGGALLFTGALPTGSDRLAVIADLLPLSVIETSHFFASLVGAILIVLGRGLQQRVRAALYLTAGLLGIGAVLSVFQGFAYEVALLQLAVLGVLLAVRRAFYRESALTAVRLTPGWIATVLGVFLASVWLGTLAYGNVAYANRLWWQVTLQGNAPRFLRASVGVAGLFVMLGLFRLLRPTMSIPALPTAADLERAREIAKRSPSVEAHLALLGDKSLLFDADREAFVMYRPLRRSWVTVGGPIGPPEKRRELVWSFRDLVARYGGRPVFYGMSARDLPLVLDLGLTPYKLGEQARVPLADFSLEGSARKKLRYTYRRAQRNGYSFEVLPREAVPDVLPALRRISTEWLDAKRTREIGFSLGYFNEAYLRNFPIAVIRFEGEIVAFANILEGGGKELSVDLMRYSTDAPPRVMEYLFIELMLYGSEEGYEYFDLGMAPLSGLENRPLAPLWDRVGTILFRHGEHFYNYRGLRSYKEKFDPEWESRYLACPGRTALPIVLLDVAVLISGRRPVAKGPRSGGDQPAEPSDIHEWTGQSDSIAPSDCSTPTRQKESNPGESRNDEH